MAIALRIATRTVLLLAVGMLLQRPAAADEAPLSASELLQLAQQSTFEVVLPKFEPDYVRYEKALPTELLSFRERTDRFWSIGTAFAIAADTYVSAAHVLLSGMGSAMGQPHLRDAAGKTYPVEQVLKFSLHEDFIVFRVRGLAATGVLRADREPATGGVVYAVGNALGDGVVLRDGLLTSLTPEDQDGRWKWLRFSAAASPGNSGGPLLDARGRVLAVITAKSPGENLNYGLPIARVLDATSAAMFDVRGSVRVPILRQQLVSEFKDSFPLPARWDDFARTVTERSNRQHATSQQRLLEENAAQMPPHGNAARLLATLDRGLGMGLVHQQADDSWEISEPESEQETRLDQGATLWTGSLPGAFSFRLERPADQASNAIYHDDVAFMDTLLKGMKLPRAVGTQSIRITSLGAPQKRGLHKDRFGRTWQARTWLLGYTDLQLVTMTLPTPEGYVGLVQLGAAISYQNTQADLQLLADHVHASYRGSTGQWRTLLAERELCPLFLRDIQYSRDAPLFVPLRGMDVRLPASLMPLAEDSRLLVLPDYIADGNQLRIALGGITLESSSEEDTSWIGVWGQPRPAASAGKELNDRWRKLDARGKDFDGHLQYTADYSSFWTVSSVGDAARDQLYEVTLTLMEKSLLPRQVSERRDQLLAGLHLRKKSP